LQPIQALEHPIFKKLVDVAARAKNGVKIPGRKVTWGEIKHLFKDHLTRLRTELNVSNFFGSCLFSLIISHLQGPTVQGEVSLTCDAWQASNTDGYFAVMAHWIRELAHTKWELESALIGFTKLNNSHNGIRLGHALFKIVKRVRIENKVSKCYHALGPSYLLSLSHGDTHSLAVNVVIAITLPPSLSAHASPSHLAPALDVAVA
jgi:hypothetical protein